MHMISRIGIYDSGMGGLSVMRAVHALLPQYNLYYLADSAYCPYGIRPAEEVRERSRACTRWLMQHGAKMVVIACNTATSAALEMLRIELPIPVIGMEPGIKPAIAATRTRQVGVLATNGTLNGNRFATLLQRFATDVDVHTIPCPDLVEHIEAGQLDAPPIQATLQCCLAPLREKGVDTIVLGCTHYHFAAPLITRITGPDVTVIDTTPAVARQVERVAHEHGLLPGQGTLQCATTGAPEDVKPVLHSLWGSPLPVVQAHC